MSFIDRNLRMVSQFEVIIKEQFKRCKCIRNSRWYRMTLVRSPALQQALAQAFVALLLTFRPATSALENPEKPLPLLSPTLIMAARRSLPRSFSFAPPSLYELS